MSRKSFYISLSALMLVIMLTSFTIDSPVKRFSPVGVWEYSVPGVQPGYESGTMVIARDGKKYKVTLQLNEYFKVEAEKVEYKRKSLSFTVWVETEEIQISGSFEENNYSATLSYFEGDFELTASRKLVE